MGEALRRSALRKLENAEAFPLIALQGIQEVRGELDELEARSILRSRDLGASLEDIADAMGITRQGVSYRLKALNEERSVESEGEDIVDLSAEETERPTIP